MNWTTTRRPPGRDRPHRAPASVESNSHAPAIAFSLITRGLSSGSLRGRVLPGCEVCSFLFRRSGPRRLFVGAVSASQFHAGPSGGQNATGACRGRIGPARCGGLEGLLAGEDVPGGDQDLARDGGLGRVLARALGDIGVERVPRVRGRQACWAASTAAQRRVRDPALESAPVRERSPDWSIFGARPA